MRVFFLISSCFFFQFFHKKGGAIIRLIGVLTFFYKRFDVFPFKVDCLQKLTHAETISELRFYPAGGWSSEDVIFDFDRFSELIPQYLPNLKYIQVRHMLIKNFELQNLDQIRELHLIDPQTQDGKWSLDLPELRELTLENHCPPVSNFAQAILQSPKIESFFAHK